MGEQSNVSSKTCVSNKNLQNKPLICFNNFEDKFLESKLEDICTFYKGKGISKEDISPEGIPCIRYGELYTKYKENIESIFSKTNLPKETLVFSEKGDILIPTSGESAEDIATASCLNRGGIALGSDITILRTKINSLYLAYYINFKKNEIAKLAQGVSIVHLYPKDLKEYKIKYPSLEEQEKVVNFLKLIDLKINSLEKTLVQYEKIEKHYIKKIYTNISDGEKISLKNIFNVDSSNLSINSLEENNGKYKLYGAEGVIKTIDFYEKMEPYISIIKDGAGVGRLNLCDAYSSSLGTLQNLVPKENFDINFLYFYLKTLNFQKYIVGSTIPHIYFRDYSKEKLSIPNIEKQKNIGNFFIYFEKRNILLNNKIGCLTNFKKYLLQNMFI